MSTNVHHLQPPPGTAAEPAPHPTRSCAPPIDPPRPIIFYSIEIDTPARDFWECLARLLSLLGALARRRACGR